MALERVVWFCNQLAKQDNLVAAARLLADCGRDLGWERLAFHTDTARLLLPRTPGGGFVVVNMGWAEESVTNWVYERVSLICPVTSRCTASQGSFLWECNPEGESWRDIALSQAQRSILKSYRDYAAGGVTVPVHQPGGRTAYVSWFERDSGKLRSLYQDTWHETHLISHAFIEHALDLNDAGCADHARAEVLTARELECLRWAAHGRTEAEIAAIIGRSRETVHFHLQNVHRKLHANNRAHAVAIACSHGLIRLS